MESTEKCEVVIQHFNGKYLKTPPGIPGESHLFCFTLLSHHPFLFFFFFGWGRHHFAIRNCLSNSLMVIPHLRSAGQLDRLRTLLFLTSEANCRGSGSIADGSIQSLPRSLSNVFTPCHRLSPWWCSGCRLELLGQEKTLLIFTLMPLCCSSQST